MSVIDVQKDLAALTLTVTSRFEAAPPRVWQVWSDPRQLERWWGPPSHPATVVEYELTPGGTVTYYMTAPDGQRFHGWWRVRSVGAPSGLEFEDGFADDEGKPNPDLPTTIVRVTLDADEAAGGAATVMRIVTTFGDEAAMKQVLDMGVAEGMSEALGQIDALLAA
ncbi:conserved hypothetical protein [Frankia canadensis]|uniref:Activator of Hsp90 ATPase homologue 1/2-like C-terminal domain-containing protein n=1 Tax=Frankia canadensis TaxID=1836972 RepID=A0A2I2KW81_9ACTN|nr:SRPBCC domain-containing protein [Frankia canadensis]SNQ49915.1 conserved hypothetical protein [Frankia canadensis]SOU57205.1 conserved hypothetical protein [Frankia canadensis]